MDNVKHGRYKAVEFDGAEVYVYRSERDGRIVVDIQTGGLEESDADSNGVPNIRIAVNDADYTVGPNSLNRD